jgi:hypothetical protein
MGAYLCIASNGVPPTVSKRIKVSVDCKYQLYTVQLQGITPGNWRAYNDLTTIPCAEWDSNSRFRYALGLRFRANATLFCRTTEQVALSLSFVFGRCTVRISRKTEILIEVFEGFLSPSREILGYYLIYTTDIFFWYVLSNLIFTIRPTWAAGTWSWQPHRHLWEPRRLTTLWAFTAC